MKGITLSFLICTLFAISSCKTQEDIRREKNIDNLHEQVAESQKSFANTNSRFDSIETQVATLTGQIEELFHGKNQDTAEITTLKEKITLLEETNKKQAETVTALTEKMQEQAKYIEDVTKSLSSLVETKEPAAPKKKEAEEKKAETETVPTLKSALIKFKETKFDEAQKDFLQILDAKKSKTREKEASLYYLGIIEFKKKNFEEAKVYFSKLFTNGPESSYAPSSLLYLAKTFLKQKAKTEATQSLDELLARFPKSKEATEAQKLKAKI